MNVTKHEISRSALKFGGPQYLDGYVEENQKAGFEQCRLIAGSKSPSTDRRGEDGTGRLHPRCHMIKLAWINSADDLAARFT